MATCKECLHVEVCKAWDSSGEIQKDNYKIFQNCPHFKDRSRFVELKHAEWVEDEDMYGDPIYRCSACSERFILEEGTPTDNGYSYCPNCGAKMDEQALKERDNSDM